MKKILKNLTRILAIFIIIPVISLTFISCSKDKNQPTPPETEQNQPVVEHDDNPNSPVKSGIYKYEKNLSIEDMFYVDEKAVIDFFKTKDMNGVRKTLLNIGFVEFAQSITEINNLPKYLEFNSKNEVTTFKNNNGIYTSLDKFIYEYNDTTSTFKSSGTSSPVISYDLTNNITTLLYRFTYVDSNNNTIVTPLYVKANLVYVCQSFESMISEETTSKFTYKDNSLEVITSSTNVDMVKVNEKLVELFELDKETTDIISAIESILSKYNTVYNDDFSIAAVYMETNGILTFSFSSISERIYNIDSVKVEVLNSNYNPNIAEVNAYITINDEAALKFTLTNNSIENNTETNA